MRNESDPVDDALESLRGRSWPGDRHNLELESRLMREFASKKAATSRLGGHRVLIAALAVVLLGSVAFAAAGGMGLFKSLFVTMEVNGEEVEIGEVVLDENGTGTFDVPPLPIGEDEEYVTLSMTIEGGEAGELSSEDADTVIVSVSMDDEVGVITVTQEEPDDE